MLGYYISLNFFILFFTIETYFHYSAIEGQIQLQFGNYWLTWRWFVTSHNKTTFQSNHNSQKGCVDSLTIDLLFVGDKDAFMYFEDHNNICQVCITILVMFPDMTQICYFLWLTDNLSKVAIWLYDCYKQSLTITISNKPFPNCTKLELLKKKLLNSQE